MSMPRSRSVPLNFDSTRFSTSDEMGPRSVRMGMEMVETSGGRAWPAALHATMKRSGNKTHAARALQLVIMSDTTTRGIRVEVESEFLADRSDRDTYYFAYHIRISNVGVETAQLVSREWIITDGDGNVERVQ